MMTPGDDQLGPKIAMKCSVKDARCPWVRWYWRSLHKKKDQYENTKTDTMWI
jgi:hypothetical protein